MTGNRGPDRRGDLDPADLRSVLSAWQVPGAPPDVEDRLRSTFRRRRAARRRPFWAAAAVLALVAIPLWHVTRPALRDRMTEGPVPRKPSEPAVGRASSEPTQTATQQTMASGAPTTRARLARTRATAVAERNLAIIVEPDQAELVRQLGQQLAHVRQAPPDVSVPRVELASSYAAPPLIPELAAVRVPRYGANWKPVTGEWPATQLAVPTVWR